jgi:hypothetical protein
MSPRSNAGMYIYLVLTLTLNTDRIKRLGRARPEGAGCPPYYYLTYLTYFTLILTFNVLQPITFFKGAVNE